MRFWIVGLAMLLAAGLALAGGEGHEEQLLRGRFAPKGTPPKYARNTPYLIRHVKIVLTVLPRKKSIAGHVVLTVAAKAQSRSSITLDAAELNVKRVQVDGKKASFTGEGHKLHVTIPGGLALGKDRKVRIDYDAKPRTGLHFVLPSKADPHKPVMVYSQGESEYNRFWFPSYDTPNMRFTSETVITVPKPLMVISNGKLLSKKDKGKLSTFHHKMKYNHVNYLVSLAIGKFAVYKQSWDGIPILSYVPPKDLKHAKRAFENTADMMKFFSQKIGVRYPYSKYAQVVVHNFVAGGMENITATTLNHRTMRDARAQLDRTSDGLVAHELAHQWFGDLITCKDWSHIWLNEGFATYFQQLYYEHKWGKHEFDYSRMRSLRWYWYGYKRPIVTRVYWHPSDVFDSHAYPKGAAVLHMIRRRLGDALWWKAIKTYTQRFAHKTAETSDLRKVFEQVSGLNWEPFFDQWIHRAGHPVAAFSWRYNSRHKQVRVYVKQKQKGKVFRFDTQIKISDGKTTKVVPLRIAKRSESIAVSFAKRPKLVELDPKGDILMKIKAKKSHQQWRYQLLHGSSVHSRARAAGHLGKYSNRPKVLAALKQVLRDAGVHYGIRRAVARALGKIAGKKGCKILMDGMDVKASRVRSVVASQLSACKDSKPLQLLVTHMRLDESYAVRAAAVSAIGKLRHKRSLALLLEALEQKGNHGRIQSAALWAMTRLETAKVIPHVRRMMPRGNFLSARLTAVSVYASLIAFHHPRRKKAHHYLRIAKYLKDPHPWMRGTAVRALSILGDVRAVPLLRRYAEQAPVRTVGRRVRQAIRQIYKKIPHNRRLSRFGKALEALKRKHRKLLERLKRLEKRRREKH